MAFRNYNIPELRRLDIEHHLPAQANYGEIVALGGSRIITRADGCTVWDGDGNALLDGMAGLWCVNVGYGREELAQAAGEQMRELPFYNTFFKELTETLGHCHNIKGVINMTTCFSKFNCCL